MAEMLDLNKISSILDLNGKDNASIKQCQENFSKYISLPKFGPLLLTLALNRDNQYSDTIALNAAIKATSVFPKPTSPQSNLSIGEELSISSFI